MVRFGAPCRPEGELFMNKKLVAWGLLLALLLTGCGAAAKTTEDACPADGVYQAAVTLTGGSGRAGVESPARLRVENGKIYATIVWSSSYYDYMIVDGVRYEPLTTEGHSTFEIPVAGLDRALPVTADTVAMSEPHEIDYTLQFDSATLTAADAAPAA